MSPLEHLLLAKFAVFVLVLARVGALVMTAPLLGTKAAPVHFRIFLAAAMTLILTPLLNAPTAPEATSLLALGKFIVNEALVGLLLGLGLTILLSGAQLTGQVISQLGGTALADSYDPNVEENIPVYAQLLYFLTLAMFVLLDGHRLTIEALLDTYAWLPPGKALMGPSFVSVLSALMGQSFQIGMRAAAPGMTALLLSTLVLGLIARTLPQINVLAVGFNLSALLTSGILVLSVGAVAWAFPQQTVDALDLMRDAVREAAELGKLSVARSP